MSQSDYPLHVAAMGGDIESILRIVEHTNVNQKDSTQCTALITAIKYGQIKAIETLLSKGANPDLPQRLVYPIHYAAQSGNLIIFKLLMKYNATLDVKGYLNHHCIHFAAELGHLNIVMYLVNVKKVDIYMTDSFMRTPLTIAICYGHHNIAKFLIEQNTDAKKKYSCKNNPLHVAVMYNRVQIIELLIRNNTNVNQSDCLGWTPLHYAANCGLIDVTKTLCEAGGNYFLSTKCGNDTPLHLAVSGGNTSVVEYLLLKGVPIDFQSPSGDTGLHIAVQRRNLTILHFLIEKGANLNIQNSHNFTPLDLAVKMCNLNIINTLIQNLAYFEVKDNGKCGILELLLQNPLQDELQQSDRFKAAEIIIKFAVIRNRWTPPSLPKHPFSRQLSDFWNDCRRKMEVLDNIFVGESNITQYDLLKSMFNDRKLGSYLNNESVLKFCDNIKENLLLEPVFNNIDIFLENGLKNGSSRQRLVQYVDSLITENVTKNLPPEIRLKIINYINITDIPFVNNVPTRKWTIKIN